MFLFAPLYYVFGSYTMLIVQIAAILFGGIGVYKLSEFKRLPHYLPLMLTAQFFCIWGIYSALAFDFHNHVIGAMLVPWLVYYYEKNQIKGFLIYFILILFTKENMALWLVFILLGLVVNSVLRGNGRTNWRNWLRLEIPLIVLTSIYFVVISGTVMPPLREGAGQDHLARYAQLGESFPEMIETVFTEPAEVFNLLFLNTSKFAKYDHLKVELYFMLLVSGGVFMFRRPGYLIMIIPIIAQKMFSNHHMHWSINAQYSIELVPIISLCLVEYFSSRKNANWAYALGGVLLFTTGYSNYLSLEDVSRQKLWAKTHNARFYRSEHYSYKFNVQAMHDALGRIPNDASVSASSLIVPHVAQRAEIYLYPHLNDAEYVALLKDDRSAYPLPPPAYFERIEKLREDPNFEMVEETEGLLIFRRVE